MNKKSIKCEFHGVFNPLLCIKIKQIKDLEIIEVYENEKKLETNLNYKKKKVLVKLFYNRSKVMIKLKFKNKKVRVIYLKNNIMKRILYKLYVNLFYSKYVINDINAEPKKIIGKSSFSIINSKIIKSKKGINTYEIIFETKDRQFDIYIDKKTTKEKLKIEKITNELYSSKFNINKYEKELFIEYNDGKNIIRTKLRSKTKYRNTIFYQYSKIGIESVDINGLLNTSIIIKGTINLKNVNYKLLVNKNEIQFDLIKQGNIYNFYIKSILPKRIKLIEFFININNKDILIYETKNVYFKILTEKLRIAKIYSNVKRTINIFVHGIKFLWKEHHFLVPIALWGKYYKTFKNKLQGLDINVYNPFNKEEYNLWLKENEKTEKVEKFNYNPLISVVIPVYNVESKYLKECIDSILNQYYQNFEICLADDCSSNKETLETLKYYEKKDNRIKVIYRKENGHISEASNSALKISNGEFIAMMDNDDIIPKNALYEMVKVLNKNPEIDFIYTDEDKIDLDGKRCEPNFKSDYAPDSLLSSNYFCHFTLLRKDILEEIGGWRKGFEGAQDYDLFLRFVEKTNRIYHIPKILYHWRKIPGSTSMDIDNKNYAIERGKLALEESLKRRKIKGKVEIHEKIPYYKIRYEYDKESKVSILIPTRDYAKTLNCCLQSIYKKTSYKNYEVIIINNQSKEKETFDLFEKYKTKYSNFKVIDVNTEFNFSNLCNVGVKNAVGDYIVLLNNDTELITKNWLEIMIGYASQKHIGTVGVKLYYPDNTVQHGGVVAGIGGVAQHAFLYYDRNDYGIYGRLAVPYNYSINTAACLMVNKEKYNEVNGFEEQLKVAFNDVDFNLKLVENGYYNVFLPQVELYHYESKSRGLDTTTEKYKRFLSEVDFMQNKWKKYIKKDPFYNPNLSLNKAFMLDKKKQGDYYEKN